MKPAAVHTKDISPEAQNSNNIFHNLLFSEKYSNE